MLGVDVDEKLDDDASARGVEGPGRLIGQDDGRSVDDRPGDGDALSLPAGQLVGEASGEGAEPQVVEHGGGIAHLLACRVTSTDCNLQADVFLHREVWKQVIGLVDHAERAPAEADPVSFGEGGDGLVADPHGAVGGHGQSREQPEQR